MKQHNEQFFQDLARAYVEHDGTVLKEADLSGMDLTAENLEKRVFHQLKQLRQKQRIRRLTYGLMPVAAVLLVVIIYTAIYPLFQRYEALTDEAMRLGVVSDNDAPEMNFAITEEAEEEYAADDTDDIWMDEMAEAAGEPAEAPAMDTDDDADDAVLSEVVESEDAGDDAGYMFSSTIEQIALPSGFQLVGKTILSPTEVSYTILSDTGHYFYVTETLISETWRWDHREMQPPEDLDDFWSYYTKIGERHILGIYLVDLEVYITIATYDDYESLFLLGEAIVAQVLLP